MVASAPHAPASLDDPVWQTAHVASVAHFHPNSSEHRPATTCRALYDSEAIYLLFEVVDDRWVVARHGEPNGPVYQDSCVEFFFSPADGMYINVETNCLANSLVQLHTKPREGSEISAEQVARIVRSASLTGDLALGEEREGPVGWRLGLTIPLALVTELAGAFGPRAPAPGVEWRANFYKCADGSKCPHWGSWSPIGEELNFHQPAHFGRLVFS